MTDPKFHKVVPVLLSLSAEEVGQQIENGMNALKKEGYQVQLVEVQSTRMLLLIGTYNASAQALLRMLYGGPQAEQPSEETSKEDAEDEEPKAPSLIHVVSEDDLAESMLVEEMAQRLLLESLEASTPDDPTAGVDACVETFLRDVRPALAAQVARKCAEYSVKHDRDRHNGEHVCAISKTFRRLAERLQERLPSMLS